MSVLETPRLLFRGNVSWDPITTNNYPKLYDEDTAESALPPAATIQQRVADYRQKAIASVSPQANPGGSWNPHGTHRSSFFDTVISGVDTGSGVSTDDLAVGSPVGFSGMLVDTEPYGATSSQLFFDRMTFGVEGGCLVQCPRTTRMIARYINFGRNSYNRMVAGVASVIWQTSFAKSDGLKVADSGSAALQALGAALADDDIAGLTVRWNSYRTIYYDDPALRNGSPQYVAAAKAQIERLRTGGFQPNPARSLLVGVLGLWRQGEPAHEPGDRALLSTLPGEVVGTAYARLDSQRLTIDLANSVPENDELLTKQDLGTLHVVAVDPADPTGAPVAEVGSLAYPRYDKTAYEAGCGILTLDLDAAGAQVAATHDLQVRGTDGTVYLAEEAGRALPVQPSLYLDEAATDPTTDVAAYVRGVPAPAGTQVTMFVQGPPPTLTITPLSTATTDQRGVASFDVPIPSGGSITAYLFAVGTDPAVPTQLDTQRTPYMWVRVLPSDAAIAALPPTWDNVYGRVLSTWNAIAPCMDNWLRLGDETQMRSFASALRWATDPVNFESFYFMPVHRDMTTGERSLLLSFLATPADAAVDEAGEADSSPEPAPAERHLTSSAPPGERDLSALSRRMRTPAD